MVHQSLIRLIVPLLCFAAIFCAIDVQSKLGPAVERIDTHLTGILFQRELHLEISKSPKEKCRTAMMLYILPKYQNSRKFLKTKGFRSNSSVYRYNWSKLTCSEKVLLIQTLFPKDALTKKGWEHTIIYSGKHGETLWRLGLWFTGSGNNYSKISKNNNLNPKFLPVGKKILIRKNILDPCFTNSPKYPLKVGNLVYQLDKKGVYAEYTLLKGQTIYSQVLRFTPRVTAAEVLEASKSILARSNLKSFHTIPTNFVLKIPSDLISPQYLPPDDPRRLQFEATDRESSRFKPKQKAKLLSGITVVLDAGHGGVDPGAIGKGNIKEDEYAYDVMCRVKQILESETEAIVFVTIEDEETGYTPRTNRFLKSGKNKEKILTTPAYHIKNAGTALNLRWILSNYLFAKKCNSKTRDEKVVFTSFHVDSLHYTASGLMIYIPGADYYQGNIKKNARVYTSRKESKGYNTVKTSRSDRLKAEGFSRSLSDEIESQCAKMGLKMHSNQPTRKFVIRRGRSWVPSILRYCKIPTRLLIELANLQNTNDVKQIMDP
ncbi:N-acetylmuramoyl-L-alanine amidase, partial [bacterium]|nr:N-acetylmuramoyl-L-alanine amidase [bacterium]